MCPGFWLECLEHLIYGDKAQIKEVRDLVIYFGLIIIVIWRSLISVCLIVFS